ncbi:hypothetical protein FRB93_013479 [Tulasnella sp. JGI-2019a]|nr:hypothetical protein FRB93_013479 [Tulasnella sp. JGI-2019a]
MSLEPLNKRRRSSQSEEPEVVARGKKPKLRLVTARYVQEKLKYRLNELQKVAERSKAGEIRNAQKDPKNTGRLSLLQEIDCNRLACSVLYKKILKAKDYLAKESRIAVALVEVLPEELRKKSNQPATKDAVDAEARVINNKHFQDELKMIMEHLVGLAAQPLPEVKSRPQTSPEVDNEEWDGVDSGSGPSSDAAMSVGGGDDDGEMSDRVYGFNSVEEGSVDDDGWDSGSVDETGQVIVRPHMPSRGDEKHSDSDSASSDDAIDLNFGISELSDSAPSLEGEDVGTSITARPTTSKGKPNKSGESIFLPSLSVGFMPGEYDPYDDYENADIDGPSGSAIGRRNRRGQKARRAIWEKKYGSKAKHKQKEHEQWEQEAKRRAELKATRLAERQQGRQKKPELLASHSMSSTNPKSVSDHKSSRVGRAQMPVVSSKRIHPAWEAKMKMMQKQTAIITAHPQGKKIIFN